MPQPPQKYSKVDETSAREPDLTRYAETPMNTASAPLGFADGVSSAVQQVSTFHDPNIGQVFGGKYVIEGILGEGGMGIVYSARHKAIGKRFAIKLLHPDAVKDPETVERFKVEAQAASAIGNEHIIDIIDFAEAADGSTYCVMEMLDGKPLSQLFEELTRVPTERFVRIAKQLARGLGAAHAIGIVHRDLKPDNIFLCKRSGGETDFVKILDFGIAKVGQGTSKLTKAGAIFGTPHYMSPEQASGAPVDHRTDIYALGVMLYEGAVGRVPFDADNFMGILTQHLYKAPVPPRAVPQCPADLSPGLEMIIMRCLRKKADERYQTMQELEDDFDRLARGEVPRAAQDLMALSAGYRSLAEGAVAASGMPRPVPGHPSIRIPKSSGWPLIAGIAGVVAAVGITTAVLMNPSRGSADGSKPVDTAAVSQAARPWLAPKPSTSTGQAPLKTREIVVTVPGVAGVRFLDADGTELATDLLTFPLEESATRTITLTADGYEPKTLTLDAKSPSKMLVAMKKQPTKYVPPPTAKKPTNGTGGSSEADDPWGKK